MTESIIQASLPHAAAEASALSLAPSVMAKLARPGCEARRVFEAGAHTTRHDTAHVIGIEHALRIVNATLSSPRSA